MHFHWQNLNERRRGADGKQPRGFPHHGRAFLHWGSNADAHIEWALGGHHVGFSFRADDEGWHFMAGLPFVACFFGISAPMFRRHYERGDRELALRFHDWAMWWNVWTSAHEWHSRTPKYRNGSLHFLDVLLGKTKYATRPLEWRWIRVPMPERTYYGAACLEEASWSRPRWPTRRIIRCEINMLPGEQVPHPGKGENSWDCGEDATFGLTTPAQSIDDGIAQLVGAVLRSRTRHGGHEWAPESKAPDLGGALPVQP